MYTGGDNMDENIKSQIKWGYLIAGIILFIIAIALYVFWPS